MLPFPVCHWGGAKHGLQIANDNNEWLVHEANDLAEGNNGIFTISVHVRDRKPFSFKFGSLVTFNTSARFAWSGFVVGSVIEVFFAPDDVDGTGDVQFSAIHQNLTTLTPAINLNDGQWHHILYSATSAGPASVLYVDNVSVPTTSLSGTSGIGWAKIKSPKVTPPSTGEESLHLSITGQEFDTVLSGSAGMTDLIMSDLWIDFGAAQTWSTQLDRDKWNYGNIVNGSAGGVVGDIHLTGDGEDWRNNVALGSPGGDDYMSVSDDYPNGTLVPGAVPPPVG